MAGLVRQLKRDAVRKPTKKNKDANIGMQVGEVWMGAQMWADDLIVATSHADWETAKEYMKVLMRSTKEWADSHGVRFCDDKSKVLVIGKQFSGACEQTERPGVSKTKWPIGTEEKSFKSQAGSCGYKWRKSNVKRISRCCCVGVKRPPA